jgi:hypothetical protein
VDRMAGVRAAANRGGFVSDPHSPMCFIRRLAIVALGVVVWWLLATLAYWIAGRTTPRCPAGAVRP